VTGTLQFKTAKKGIRWWWKQRARKFGQAQDVDRVRTGMSDEELDRVGRTYADMVKCMNRQDGDGEELHPLLARAAVLSSIDVKGNDQQNEADSTFAFDIIESSALYAGRGLGIIERRMARRKLLVSREDEEQEEAVASG